MMPQFKHKYTEYSKINRYIYIGTNFCCRKHFAKSLLRQGITTDISLEDNKIDTPFGVKCYLWLPVKDHHPPSRYQFLTGVSCIDKAVKNNNKVYVHCQNGHGRAPTLVAAYLISQGMSVKEAIDLLKSKRAEIHLRPSQLKALKKFARGILKDSKINIKSIL